MSYVNIKETIELSVLICNETNCYPAGPIIFIFIFGGGDLQSPNINIKTKI